MQVVKTTKASYASACCNIWIDISHVGNKIVVSIENTLGEVTNDSLVSSGSGLRLVNERIEIFNKTYRDNISMELDKPVVHCKRGYRVELYFRD